VLYNFPQYFSILVLRAAEVIIIMCCVDVTFNDQELQDVPVHKIYISVMLNILKPA